MALSSFTGFATVSFSVKTLNCEVDLVSEYFGAVSGCIGQAYSLTVEQILIWLDGTMSPPLQ
jgi:hypothetical protein